MHPANLEHTKQFVAFAIYIHQPRENAEADWEAAKRLLEESPFQPKFDPGYPIPDLDTELCWEEFEWIYGKAAYYHALNCLVKGYQAQQRDAST